MTADPFSAVVTLTHVDHIDDEALAIALKSPCRYIGALGSRKTHAKRVARLKDTGFTDADIARINAPVGIDIEAETAGEIATSILAQIISAFRKAPE
jgi:xanthine dehydrogenase accessory factor